MQFTIYHHAKCSTSRFVLEAIKSAGHKPTIIEYQKTPLSADELKTLADQIGIEPSGLLRTKEPLYKELGLANKSENEVLIAIAKNPRLLERPIVHTSTKTIIARPKELIHDLL